MKRPPRHESPTLISHSWISGLLAGVLACSVGCGAAGGEIDPSPELDPPPADQPPAPDQPPSCESTDSCGGGEVDAPVGSGVFVGPVSGLRYETETTVGVTDEEGRFYFEPGEQVTFSLGNAVLGQTIGKAQVSPFDLVEGAEIITDGDAVVNAEPASPIQLVMNITVLLYTLDDDGDAENGIDIREDAAALFDGETLNLDQTRERFRTDPVFRGALNRANQGGMFSDTRPVANVLSAMDHLYRVLDVELIYTAFVSRVTYDDDGTANEHRSFEFDDLGRVTRVFEHDELTLYDYDDHGRVVRVQEFGEWGAEVVTTHFEGNTVREERIEEKDGVTTVRVTTTTLDDFGREVRDRYTVNGELRRIREYGYRNNTLQSIRYGYYSDGSPSSSEMRIYRDGKLVTIGSWDALGNLESSHAYSYNERGQQTVRENDSNGDGVVDRRHASTYDENGNRLRVERDGLVGAVDGSPDYVKSYVYDENGNRIREEEDGDFSDGGADGSPDFVETYAYDEHGNRTRHERDGDLSDGGANGVFDYLAITSYEYDSDRVVRKTVEQFENDSPEPYTSTYSYSYDDGGRLTRERRDSTRGCSFIRHYTYDQNGSLVREEYDTVCDEKVDSVTTYRSVGWHYFAQGAGWF